jgi:DNA-directed RNA polymerase subunit E"
MRKQACKNCKIFIEGEVCPICKGTNVSPNWQGRIHFLDTKKSFIAHQMGVEKPGEYALKVR